MDDVYDAKNNFDLYNNSHYEQQHQHPQTNIVMAINNNKRFKDNYHQQQHPQNHQGLISDHIGASRDNGENDLIDELHFNGSDGGDQINNNNNNSSNNSSNDIPRCIRHSNDTNNNSLNTTSTRSTDSINGKKFYQYY